MVVVLKIACGIAISDFIEVLLVWPLSFDIPWTGFLSGALGIGKFNGVLVRLIFKTSHSRFCLRYTFKSRLLGPRPHLGRSLPLADCFKSVDGFSINFVHGPFFVFQRWICTWATHGDVDLWGGRAAKSHALWAIAVYGVKTLWGRCWLGNACCRKKKLYPDLFLAFFFPIF